MRPAIESYPAAAAYYRAIGSQFPLPKGVRSVVVAMMDEDKQPFFDHLNPAFILAKRRIHLTALAMALQSGIPVTAPTHAQMKDHLLQWLERYCPGQPVIIFDIGARCAESLPEVLDRFSGQVVAVVEDTFNGALKWAEPARHGALRVPVMDCAGAALKEAEHARVGWSIVQSAQDVLSVKNQTINGTETLVIGYGRVGSNVAAFARALGANVTVRDIDPAREAMSDRHGFHVAADTVQAVKQSAVILVASSGIGMSRDEIRAIPDGAHVGGATSPGELLTTTAIAAGFTRTFANDSGHATFTAGDSRSWTMMSDDAALNFWSRPRVGPEIHLMLGGLVIAGSLLLNGSWQPGLHQFPAAYEAIAAQAFGESFYPGLPDPTPETFGRRSFDLCIGEAHELHRRELLGEPWQLPHFGAVAREYFQLMRQPRSTAALIAPDGPGSPGGASLAGD